MTEMVDVKTPAAEGSAGGSADGPADGSIEAEALTAGDP